MKAIPFSPPIVLNHVTALGLRVIFDFRFTLGGCERNVLGDCDYAKETRLSSRSRLSPERRADMRALPIPEQSDRCINSSFFGGEFSQ